MAITVDTHLKGLVEFQDSDQVVLSSPILGFEQFRRFVIFQTSPGPMCWLQSTERKDLCFCLLAPFQAGYDPDIVIEPADAKDIGAEKAEDITVYTIVVLDRDPAKMTTNLRAPILVCHRSGKAKQVVLDQQDLAVQADLGQLMRPKAKPAAKA